MVTGSESQFSLLGRAWALLPVVAVCGACGADPAAPLLGFGGFPGAGSGGTGTATTAGTSAGGFVGSAGTFGTGGTGQLPNFGSGGTLANGGSSVSGGSGGGELGGTAAGGSATGGTEAGGADIGGTDAGGSGGAVSVGCAKSTGLDTLIDDFEDADMALKLVDGRNGPWETFDDGTTGAVYSTRSPSAAMGRGGTTGFCASISGYKAWGANLVATMASPKCGYDASTYDGVCFWAKGKVTAGGPFVFAVGTSDTVPASSGGMCTEQGRCNAHYEANPALEDGDYKQYCYKWSALKLPNIVNPPAFSSSGLVQIEWKFPAVGAKSTDGSFCVDDVSFCKGDACVAP
jgi:hypothetical protein